MPSQRRQLLEQIKKEKETKTRRQENNELRMYTTLVFSKVRGNRSENQKKRRKQNREM